MWSFWCGLWEPLLARSKNDIELTQQSLLTFLSGLIMVIFQGCLAQNLFYTHKHAMHTNMLQNNRHNRATTANIHHQFHVAYQNGKAKQSHYRSSFTMLVLPALVRFHCCILRLPPFPSPSLFKNVLITFERLFDTSPFRSWLQGQLARSLSAVSCSVLDEQHLRITWGAVARCH